MRWRLIGFLYFFLAWLTGLNAQEPVYRQYTNKNGLPSSEVYDVLQDHKGYLWFSTDQGLARFDGYRFKVFNEEMGLPENTVFDLELDSQGRIWVNSIQGHFSYIENEKVVPYKYNYILDSLAEGKSATSRIYDTYNVSDDGSLLINIRLTGLVRIDSKGTVKTLKSKDNNSFHELVVLPNQKLIKQSAVDRPPANTLLLNYHNSDYRLPFPHSQESLKRFFSYSVLNEEQLIYSVNSKLFAYRFSEDKTDSIQFDSNVLSLIIDPNGDLWVGTYADGVYIFQNGRLDAKPLRVFDRLSASSFYFDQEEGFWITTLNKGVFHIPYLGSWFFNRTNYFDFENVIDVVVENGKGVWLALNRGRVVWIGNDGAYQLININEKLSIEINDIFYSAKHNALIVATSGYTYFVKRIEADKTISLNIREEKRFGEGIKSVFFSSEGVYHAGYFSGYKQFNSDNSIKLNADSQRFNQRVEDIVKSGNSIYLATLDGLWKIENDSISKPDSDRALLSKRITSLMALNDTIYMGTKGNGLLILTSDTLIQLEEIDGLASNAVSSLAYNAQYIIVGTNAGLTLLKRGWSPRHVEIRSFDANSGMLSNEINGVDVDGNLLYLATANGLQRAQLTEFEKLHGHIPIYLTEVSVNQKNIPISSSLEVPFSDNNIQFDYFALSYRNRGKQTYRHRMTGIENEWVVNQKTTAQYPYLPAGNYVFEVSVRNEMGEWNPEPARINITILKPYWAKTWFLVLISLIIIAVISILFFWRIKVVNRRNQLLYDINWYQQEALINQMNPHFLFNSLNTVHRYVLQNDRMASSRYLTKFATLMRKILDNSQEKFISIAKEVDALRLYLELESARFKDKFQFSIDIDPSIPQEKVMIPVFIIQPIVENAIWHGLMHSDKPGLISIKFNRINGKNLVVSVRDNGIGREESEKIRESNKPDQRKSLGLAIIKRRIALINAQQRTNIKITYNDLKHADGSCSGTEVIVHFPNFLTPYSNESFQSNSN